MKLLITAVLAICAMGCTAVAQSTGIFHFTGTDFKEGTEPGSVSISTHDGFLPGIRSDEPPAPSVELPAGSGGLALLCFIQTSGGKLGSKAEYQPMAGAPVQITGNGLHLAARTNEAGYLFLSLPAGQYEVRCSGFSKKIRIDNGKNTLSALRGGKRMVD